MRLHHRVAVSFKATNTRSRSIQPLHLQLQQDLRRSGSNSRSISSGNGFDIDVKPLGENIALVNLPSGTRSSVNSVQQQIQKQSYVKETLPILTRKSGEVPKEKESEQVIVLPNEIAIAFDRDMSESQKQMVLLRHDLEVVRPLRFSKNRYLVRSKSVSGTEILNLANQLTQVTGVQSATPNFIQATSYQQSQLLANLANLPEIPNAAQRLEQQLAQLPQPKDTPISAKLLPLQWHLNSTPKRGQLLPRTAGNENLDGVAFPAGIPGVVSVGATNMAGNRTFYSSYGGGLDVVAPGGEIQNGMSGGILTTGGTWLDGFWQGMSVPDNSWGMALDSVGKYVHVQGTSFSAPIVSGVVALMKGEDPKRRLSRDEMVSILKKTATYDGLNISSSDVNRYRLQKEVGFGTVGDTPISRPSGIFAQAKPVSAQEYFFGRGLVNADAAVETVRQR